MRQFIALLRGINVGGKTIKMNDLKNFCESLGLSDVTTYIQSGNILFNGESIQPEIKLRLEEVIQKNTGLDVCVLVREWVEWKRIMEGNPWLLSGWTDVENMHVTFLDKEPAQEKLHTLIPSKDPGRDEFRVHGREIYLYCPDGYSRTVFSNNFFEKKLKVRATTRNWKTVTTLYEMF